MEAEISRLAHDGLYDQAKEMRARLTYLRGEFDSLQTTGARVVRSDQIGLFETGSKALIKMQTERQAQLRAETERHCNGLQAELNKTHEIERENLEKELARMTIPSPKYSKRLIELFKAEAGFVP
jgi:hypothetical protein